MAPFLLPEKTGPVRTVTKKNHVIIDWGTVFEHIITLKNIVTEKQQLSVTCDFRVSHLILQHKNKEKKINVC